MVYIHVLRLVAWSLFLASARCKTMLLPFISWSSDLVLLDLDSGGFVPGLFAYGDREGEMVVPSV
jgi:hypothetical protein